jgi:hypothetical protein
VGLIFKLYLVHYIGGHGEDQSGFGSHVFVTVAKTLRANVLFNSALILVM